MALWVANMICCWPLVRKIFRRRSFSSTRAFYVNRNANQARKHSEQRQARDNTWWRRLIEGISPRHVDGAGEQDHEMNPHIRSSESGTRSHHNRAESRGASMFIHEELAAYLNGDSFPAPPRQSLARDHDMYPASAYRQAHHIE
jgi:hypothetical protein